MDCIFMGPYARMDFGSKGVRGNLPVPSWSRRNSESEPDTRVLPLPCTGAAMQGDFKVPFTCGSQTRRSIIKYFVRNFALPASGTCGSAEVNATVQVMFDVLICNVFIQISFKFYPSQTLVLGSAWIPSELLMICIWN
jgi:hypothetical protein